MNRIKEYKELPQSLINPIYPVNPVQRFKAVFLTKKSYLTQNLGSRCHEQQNFPLLQKSIDESYLIW